MIPMAINSRLLDYIGRVSRMYFPEEVQEMDTALRHFVDVLDRNIPFGNLPLHNQIARIKPVIKIAGLYSASKRESHTGNASVIDIAGVIDFEEGSLLRPRFLELYGEVANYSEKHEGALPVLGHDYSHISPRVFLRGVTRAVLINSSLKSRLGLDKRIVENPHRVGASERTRGAVKNKLRGQDFTES